MILIDREREEKKNNRKTAQLSYDLLVYWLHIPYSRRLLPPEKLRRLKTTSCPTRKVVEIMNDLLFSSFLSHQSSLSCVLGSLLVVE